jgi:PHD/YefM family antitoxin component YafN of YafNO toxin-antitoxin module
MKGVIALPTIMPSIELSNNYGEISKLCKERNEPVFITNNGRGDLAVMSMEVYHRLAGRHELCKLIDDGMEDAEAGLVEPFDDVFRELRQRLAGNGL